MGTRLARLKTASLLCFILPVLASAESAGGGDAHPGESGHAYHPNTFGLFLGAALEGREEAPAIGLEYERRFSEHFGIGGVVEYTGDEGDFWIAAIPFASHAGPFKMYAAPGFEDGEHGTEELLRLGAEYSVALSGGWEIAPQVNVDFVDSEDVWVVGLLFARGF